MKQARHQNLKEEREVRSVALASFGDSYHTAAVLQQTQWQPGSAMDLVPGRNCIHPPPSPHFWLKGIFSGEGGGGVYFEAPRGRIFIRPPPLFIHPPPLEGYFQGWGGGGV